MSTYIYNHASGLVGEKRAPEAAHLIVPLHVNAFDAEMVLLREEMLRQCAEVFSGFARACK